MQRTREILSLKHLETATEEAVFQAVCLDVSEALDADLVSIWFFDDAHSRIDCQSRYDAPTARFSCGQSLLKADYPRYFETVVEYNFIAAPDAQTHPATSELTEGYFIPNEIQSLLDFILHKDCKPIGVICCESRAKRRDWSEKDKSYLRAIASLVSGRFRFS